jgi:4-amino-4-deoxy-L-arabinose transferase-like glycosyltransferase
LIVKSKASPIVAAVAGGLVAALITLPGLGLGTLWDNSETAYGEVAREILLRGDWLIMHFNGVKYFVQPPLYFWLAALCAKVFGLSVFSLRLPSALATIALSSMTAYAVSRQAGVRVGVYASLLLSTCVMQAVIGRLAIMDALLDLTVSMTIFWWFRGLQTGKARYFAYGAGAAGFGFLAKGLVAPVVAILVLVPYYFWNRRHDRTIAPTFRSWLAGGVVFLAVTLPWPLLLVYNEHFSLAPLGILLGQYTVGRYTGVIENQGGPLWYYLPVIILGFFPWFAFLPMAVVRGVAALRENVDATTGRLLRLAFTWAVVPLIFFSLAQTKLPNYIALEFPALALLTALYFDHVITTRPTRASVISAAFVPVTIGGLAIAVMSFVSDNKLAGAATTILPVLTALGAIIFICALIVTVLIASRRTAGFAPYVLAIASIVAMDCAVIVLLPVAEADKPVPRLAAIVQRERRPGDVVAIQNIAGGNALLFYTSPPISVLAAFGSAKPDRDQGRNPRDVICGAARVWLVAPRHRPVADPTYGRRRTLVERDHKAELLLYDGAPCEIDVPSHPAPRD